MNKKQTLTENLAAIFSFCEKQPEKLAKHISDSVSSKQRLFESDISRLSSLGCTLESAELLNIVAAISARAKTEFFTPGKHYSEEEIEGYLVGAFENVASEATLVIVLDKNGKLCGSDFLSDGTVNFSSVIPRMIVERASARRGSSVIIAHNHPGGFAEFSEQDTASTALLAESLDSCGVALLAHYVVGDSKCCKINFKNK